MSDYQYFFFLLGAILGVLIIIGWQLHRIVNILIMKNKGEPSGSDITKLYLEQMGTKKKK